MRTILQSTMAEGERDQMLLDFQVKNCGEHEIGENPLQYQNMQELFLHEMR